MDSEVSIIELTINNEIYRIPNWKGGYASYFWKIISKIGIKESSPRSIQRYIIGNDFRLEWSNKDCKIGYILFNEDSASKITLIDNSGKKLNVRDIIDKMIILGLEWFKIDGIGHTDIQIHCKFSHASDNFNCVINCL